MSEADLRRALCRFPPTMMDSTRRFCRQCSKEMKKMTDFRNHILKHADIPQFRCRFCTTDSNKFTAQRREQMFTVCIKRESKDFLGIKSELFFINIKLVF